MIYLNWLFKKKDNNKSSFDQLDENGDLPPGWTYRHKEFVEPINSEFSKLLINWCDNRQSDLEIHYLTLKNFVAFLQETRKKCKSKGICYEKWYSTLIASDEYISKREDELKDLTDNYDKYSKEEILYKEAKKDLNGKLLQFLKDHPSVLQKDVYSSFSPLVKNDIQETLYYWSKENIIERTKTGNTYKIILK